MAEILDEWQSFAQTLTPAADTMSSTDLRDHAVDMLKAIAKDIETSQSPREQKQKSQGELSSPGVEKSAASVHGAGRHTRNFTLLQLTAEYRALRATVLRLWLGGGAELDTDAVRQLMRFNESVDQALAESVVAFAARADYTRDLFLAILGHDLRAPLSTMSMASDLFMVANMERHKALEVARRVKRSAAFMGSMVENLLGYARTHLGKGIPVSVTSADLSNICQDAVDAAKGLFPNRTFHYEPCNGLLGSFDRIHLQQLLTNLLCNAGQYGEASSPVIMKARTGPGGFVVEVHNSGSAIPAEALKSIFSPLVQLPSADEEDLRPRTSLGLGLYIAREIAEAHHGSIEVTSNDIDGTTFTVSLPVENALH